MNGLIEKVTDALEGLDLFIGEVKHDQNRFDRIRGYVELHATGTGAADWGRQSAALSRRN